MRLFRALPWVQVLIKDWDSQSIFSQTSVQIATPMPKGARFCPSRVAQNFSLVSGDLLREYGGPKVKKGTCLVRINT